MTRLRAIALVVSCLLSACAYGARGGVQTTFYQQGPVFTEAVATGFAGFGSTEHEVSQGLLGTVSLGLGAELGRGELAFLGLGGLEYVRVPESARRRWGFRAGVEGGVRRYGSDSMQNDLVVHGAGGFRVRLGTRESQDFPLLVLGIDVTLGMSAGLTTSGETDLTSGLSITLGFLDVRRWHL